MNPSPLSSADVPGADVSSAMAYGNALHGLLEKEFDALRAQELDRFESLHLVLRGRYPFIDRMAMAIYDPQTDLLKTLCSSNVGLEPLVAHQARLADVPSLHALADAIDGVLAAAQPPGHAGQ